MRLVGNTNVEEIRDKFFLDSLVTGHTIGLGNGTASLVDVGSGAGFPGVPRRDRLAGGGGHAG